MAEEPVSVLLGVGTCDACGDELDTDLNLCTTCDCVHCGAKRNEFFACSRPTCEGSVRLPARGNWRGRGRN